MRNLRKRNLEILQLSRAGVDHRGIAERFRLSRSIIDIIVRQLQEEEQRAKRIASLHESIRREDDLDRTWRVSDLLAALRLPPGTGNVLLRHFEDRGADTVSLRTLMNWVMPESDWLESRFLTPPLLQIRHVGKKRFWSIVNQIAALNLGDRSRQVWEQKLAVLKRSWKIKGALPYSQKPQ